MSLRLTSLSLSSSLLSIAALAGCSGIDHDARFADGSLAQLERAYAAASGDELRSAVQTALNFAGASGPLACPQVATVGQDTTITGGCTTEVGERMEGSIKVHNMPETPAYDPSQPSLFTFDFRTTRPGKATELDGHIELAKTSLSGDLRFDDGGIVSTSRLELTCKVDGPCTASPGSEIEISDLGGAGVEGTWHTGDQPSGRVTVRGADVLVIDVGARDADGCVPYAIGDKRGSFCDEPDLPWIELVGQRPLR